VVISFCYLLLRRLLQLVGRRVRSNEWKELEIVVLRHELGILRRQTRRPAMAALDRLSLPLPAGFCPACRSSLKPANERPYVY
jgi:putative transposase